jgi:hypothetical protein
MWYKYDNIGLWIWIPDNYKFRESLAFFTMHNNILDENKQIRHFGLDILKDRATIVIYENGATADIVEQFCEYVAGPDVAIDASAGGNQVVANAAVGNPNIADASIMNGGPTTSAPAMPTDSAVLEKSPFAMDRGYLAAIGIFSFTRNRYSKPFTGGMEKLQELAADIAGAHFTFRPDWSIVVSPHIGIGGKYIDRAFAHNIGIQTVITPALYFKQTTLRVGWNWPTYVLTEAQKKKLFLFDGEPRFSQFLCAGQNLVVITGPPSSGKTILGRRIAQFVGGCTLCKNELPPAKSFGTKSIVHISSAPTARDKEVLVKWLCDNGTGNAHVGTNRAAAPNLVWIEMNVSRQLAEFLRNLRVQISKQSCPALSPYTEIKNYYRHVEPLDDDKIPEVIKHLRFPLILKQIKELNYIY